MTLLTKRSMQTILTGAALLSTFGLTGTALAAENVQGPSGFIHNGQDLPRPAVVGTVASVSGTTLTVTARTWQRGTVAEKPATTTYTVDAANATVTKAGAASTVSAIAVGDSVMVQGTLNGTNIVATNIRDGIMRGRMLGRDKDADADSIASLPAGNGQPVIGGAVTAISGSTITVTNKSNVTYTIDAANASVTKRGVTSATLATIAVGDTLIVQGTVNGTSVTAATILDQGTAPSATTTGTQPEKRGGIFRSIGGFFSHLFGF